MTQPQNPPIQLPTAAPQPIAEVDLAVSGMTCASCVARVEKKLNKVPGVTAVVNLATERAHITLTDAVPTEELLAVVEKSGYGATLVKRVDDDGTHLAGVDIEAATERAAQERIADLKRRFIVAAILAVPVIGLSMVPAWQFAGWQWVIGVLSLPIAFWSGWPFHRAAFRAGRYGSSTMDTLVSLGVLASMGWSLWALFFGGAGRIGYTMEMTGIHGLAHTTEPHLYFETAAMIVTFLLIGRWLEARSRRSAGDALRALLDLGADEAFLVRRAAEDGGAGGGVSAGAEVNALVPVADLQVGDVFRVRPGETIATDGRVIDGSSAVDASLVTGESMPVEVGTGDSVIGATLNTHGTLLVEATRVGEETTLAQMGKLLTDAQTGKAPVQRLADRISSVFVPGVILIALATFFVRIFLASNSVEMALTSAITVLVVACPCALGLATPTALLVGSGRLSTLGALIRGPEVLETAHGLDAILLDKTGTLTAGQMAVTAVEPVADQTTADELLALAAALEQFSEHPIAHAIVEAANTAGLSMPATTDFVNTPGKGISATVAGEPVRLGTPSWLATGAELPDTAAFRTGTTIAVEKSGHVLGHIAVADTIRPESAGAITELKAAGLRPILLTGDNEQVARAVAKELGIDDVRAGVLPDGKLAVVQELQQSGKRVAMVGDGVNDAAALAGADLSIAMGSGTDVAKAAADLTIMNSDVRTIPAALRVSGKTLRIIKENLMWAFGYNIIAIPLAVFGVIVPGIAAAAMAGSSVIVVLNSLRLRNA